MALTKTRKDNYSELLRIKLGVVNYCRSLNNKNLNYLIEAIEKQDNNEIDYIIRDIENLQSNINKKIKQNNQCLEIIEFSDALFLYINIIAEKVEKSSLDDDMYLNKTINRCKEHKYALENKYNKTSTTWSKGNGSLSIWSLSIIFGIIFFATNKITNKYLYAGMFSYLLPAVTKISLFLATTQGIALTILIAFIGVGVLTNKLTRNQNKTISNIQKPNDNSSFKHETTMTKSMYKIDGSVYNRDLNARHEKNLV